MDNQQERMESDRNWLAGIWEGEGWFTMSKRFSRTSKGISLACGIANTDFKMIDYIMNILRENNMPFYVSDRNMNGRLGKKPQRHVLVSGFKRVKTFLDFLLPYMRTKRDRVEIILKYINYRLLLPSHNVRTAEYEWSLYDQLRKLNSGTIPLSPTTNTPNTRYAVKIESELQQKLQRLVECQPALA